MRFENPLLLLLLISIPVFLILSIWGAKRKKKFRDFYAGSVEFVLKKIDVNKILMRKILRYIALLFIILAISGPQWGKSSSTFKQKGTDLIFGLDLSRSMLSKDLKPDRFSLAKYKIKTLLEKLNIDRVGLLGFAGGVAVLCPLTIDFSTVNMLLDGVSPGDIRPPGTNLSAVLDRSKKLFEDGTDGFRNLIIFSDGEDHSNRMDSAIKEAADAGIRVFMIVLSSPQGAPVPVLDNNGNIEDYQKDKSGKMILSKPSLKKLQDMVEKTDGRLFMATQDDQDINALLKEISRLKKREINKKTTVKYKERYYFPLWFAFIALLIEFMLGVKKNEWF